MAHRKKVLKQYHLRTTAVLDLFIEGYSKKQVVDDALARPEGWVVNFLSDRVSIVASQKKYNQ